MNLTKKQWVIGGVISLVLAGGSAGIVANNQAQAQAEKTAQEAKTAYDNLLKGAKEATERAESFKAEADVKTAQAAIKKLENKDQSALISRVEAVQNVWDLVKSADKAVVSAEKSKTDATVKTAQTAIDKLKEDKVKSKKTALQKRLDKVKADIKAKKDKAAADKKAKEEAVQEETQASQAAQEQTQSQNSAQTAPVENTTSSQVETSVSGGTVDYGQTAQAPAQSTPSYTSPATGGNGGGAVAPSTPSNNTGNPAYNSGAGANANPNVSADDLAQAEKDANNTHGNVGVVNGGW